MTEDQERQAAIRTPDQRLRVFVSSTLAELAEERAAVARAISALRLTPVLFELGARPHPPRELYRAYLAQSDIFVGLYWQRYGWIGPGTDISGLELANEWRQERAQREHARQALGFILEELRTNRDAVGESLDYHAGLLRALAPPLESPPGIASFARGFVAPAHVYRTNWESASATGAFEQIDFPVLLRLSRVYAQQERYENQARTVGSLLYEEIYRGGTASIVANHAHLFELLRAVSYRERELLALYDETLEGMGGTGGGA